ncbi:hypothetical protein H5410_008545 [Solanum commersonii]|uniref:Uncharacterized protein n=1 Tax=Solanum commersonii TaxID=4109 RepID=A0A9J6AH33_SOLCO|nr:hypothetical protein H5410_008545 [Solanum commersonii]
MAFLKAFAALLIASLVLVHFTYALQEVINSKPPAPSPQPLKPIGTIVRDLVKRGAANRLGKIYATEHVEVVAVPATVCHQGLLEITKHALAISTLLLITAPANVLKIHRIIFFFCKFKCTSY